MTFLGHICLSFYLYPGGVFLSGKEHPSFLAMTALCINLQELKELKANRPVTAKFFFCKTIGFNF